MDASGTLVRMPRTPGHLGRSLVMLLVTGYDGNVLLLEDRVVSVHSKNLAPASCWPELCLFD
jgi:hypothetical protein